MCKNPTLRSREEGAVPLTGVAAQTPAVVRGGTLKRSAEHTSCFSLARSIKINILQEVKRNRHFAGKIRPELNLNSSLRYMGEHSNVPQGSPSHSTVDIETREATSQHREYVQHVQPYRRREKAYIRPTIVGISNLQPPIR